jgi:hypothetical protein
MVMSVSHDIGREGGRRTWMVGLASLGVLVVALTEARPPAHAQPQRAANASRTLAACSHPNGGRVNDGTPSQSLLSILGVLRRPATPADALPASWLHFFTVGAGAHIQGGDVFVRFVRRARVIGNTSYYLVPSLFTGCGVYKITGEGVTILAAKPNGSGSGGGHADATRIEQGQAYLTPSGASTHTTIAMLIPDGVATVTLQYPPGAVGGSSSSRAPAFTTTEQVVENLLVVTVPRGGNRLKGPMTMTWRAATGAAIKTFARL